MQPAMMRCHHLPATATYATVTGTMCYGIVQTTRSTSICEKGTKQYMSALHTWQAIA
jgi:hypothetical protein